MRIALVIALFGACDTVEDRPATWSYIHAAIVAPSCATANCHSSVSSTAGIDLSTRSGGYLFLLGRVCQPGDPSPAPSELPPGNYVFPGHPERSPMIHLLRGDANRLMPPDIPLPPIEIDLVEQWIYEGATCE